MATADKVFSEAENRRLEQAPKLSTAQIMDGRFVTKYEKYISDQFPFRDFWISVKSTTEKALGRKENNGIYLSKDGYLIEKFEKPTEEKIKSKAEEINTLIANIPNIRKYYMLVPTSVKILEDKLPIYAPNGDELVYINKVMNSIDDNINFVHVYDTLYSNKEEYIYYRTDHHWTTKGAYLSYQKLMETMGIVPHDEEYFNIEKVTESFYGSLYSKSGFRKVKPDSIELYIPKKDEKLKVEYVDEGKILDSIYHMENLNKKDKYTVFLGGNYPLIKVSSKVDSDEKLLILKDSYANSLIPFLTGHFSEIYIVDPRYYDKDIEILIKENNIDNLLILYNVKTFFE